MHRIMRYRWSRRALCDGIADHVVAAPDGRVRARRRASRIIPIGAEPDLLVEVEAVAVLD